MAGWLRIFVVQAWWVEFEYQQPHAWVGLMYTCHSSTKRNRHRRIAGTSSSLIRQKIRARGPARRRVIASPLVSSCARVHILAHTHISLQHTQKKNFREVRRYLNVKKMRTPHLHHIHTYPQGRQGFYLCTTLQRENISCQNSWAKGKAGQGAGQNSIWEHLPRNISNQ